MVTRRGKRTSRGSNGRATGPDPRRLLLEPLAARRLLAGDWQNPFLRADVNDDGLVAPVDALFVINLINRIGAGPLPIPPPDPGGPPPYFDTSGDDLLSPLDVLIIFNLINSDRTPPDLSLALANDTAVGGGTNDDLITADPGVLGNVRDPSGVQSLVFVDGVNRTPVPFDFRTGDFPFDPQLATDGSDDGPHVLTFEAIDARGNGPRRTELQFTLDTQRPTLVAALANDTAPGGSTNSDRITSDPTIAGRVTDGMAVARLRAELNGNSLGDVAFDAQGNFNLNPGLAVDGSQDGVHTVRLLAEDLAGNLSEVTLTLRLDTQAPDLAAMLASDTAPGGGTNDDGVTSVDDLQGTAADGGSGLDGLQASLDGGQARSVTVSGGMFVFDPLLATDGTADGSHQVVFQATDLAGNSTSITVPFTLDTLAPALQLGLVADTAPGGGTNDDRVTFDPRVAGIATDATRVTGLRGQLNGNSLGDVVFDAMGRFNVNHGLEIDGSDDGVHAVRVLAEDLAGNTSERTLNFRLDTEAPDLAASLSNDTAPGGGTNDDGVTSDDDTQGTASDGGSGLERLQARLDGGPAQSVTVVAGMFAFDPALAADGSADGSHQVELLAGDVAGNTARVTVPFTLDTLAPALQLGLVLDTAPDGATNDDQVTFDPRVAGQVTDATLVTGLRGQLNGNSLGDVTFDAMGRFNVSHGLTVDGGDDGVHAVRVLAEDLAGNTSERTLNFRLDTRPPALTARLSNDTAPGGGTNDDGVTSDDDTQGTASDGGSGLERLQARLDGGPAQSVTVVAGMFTFDPGLATDGSDDGGHEVVYQSVDVAGNTSSTTLSFTLDTRAPGIMAGLLNDTAPQSTTNTDGITSDPRLAGTVMTATPGIASFQASLNGGPAVDVPLDGANAFRFDPDLKSDGSDDGQHTVRFSVADLAGNSTFRDVAFTLDTLPPSEPTLALDPAFVFGPPEDGLTRDGAVSLIGSADPGVLLELSPQARVTSANGAGAFRFDGVSLQLGENALAVTAFDTAGNPRSTGRTITRLEPDVVALLNERDRFATEMSVPVDLSLAQGSRQIRFDVESLFDTSDSTSAGGDAFLVYLLDPDNRQTLLASGGQGTSLFAWREGTVEFRPGLVQFDGRTVEIEVSQLGDLETGLLVFQLINNDTDAGTRITVRRLVNEVDPEGVVSPVFPPPPQPAPLGIGFSNVDAFQATSDVDVRLSDARFDPDTGQYLGELRVANRGPATDRRVAVAFPGLPAGVTLTGASGTTGSGAPYLDLSEAIGSGGLGPDAVSQGVLVRFDVAIGNSFPLVPQVLIGGLNRPPVFDPPAMLQVLPGGYLQQPLDATDPDGDRVTFGVRSSGPLPPNSLQADGMFVVTPAPADVGSYTVTLVASDGVLETSREVTLQVPMDPVMTTRVQGQVLDVEMNPLAGVPIELGTDMTLTEADGSFILELSTPMPQQPLEVHGDRFVGPDDYPFVAEDLALLLIRPFYQGVNNVLPRPIYLPKLDTANGTQIDPLTDTLVTTPVIPEASLLVPAGALQDPQGQPFTGEVSITEVPTDLTPAALPPGQSPDFLVTIQPAELQFTTPAPLALPNMASYAPGTELDLFSINPATGQFDIVGSGQVSGDGRSVQTVTGGVRNSSWHFFSPRPTVPTDLTSNVRNWVGCASCAERVEANAQVELHSGVVLEQHPLVAYQTQGVSRGLRLVYDSLRADPRPILHFGYDAVPADDSLRMVASLSVRGDDFELQVPGRPSRDVGLGANEHFWSIPAGGGDLEAALQADLVRQPSGRYTYQLLSGLLRLQDGRFTGSRTTATADLLHVNAIDSVFGAGWGLAGLQQLVEGADGSLLLIDGDGSELLFEPGDEPGRYVSPAGDFSRLEKLGDMTFRRTLKDQTVFAFDTAGRLESITDRHANVTMFAYDGLGNLMTITDPVGETTSFTYSGGKVTEITDPAGRTTMLFHDGDGNLIGIRDPDTSQRSFDYDERHLLVEEVNKRGFRETMVYDFSGRFERSVTEDEAEIRVEPLQVQHLLPPDATLDPIGSPVAFAQAMPLAYHTDANGNTFATELDQYGQRVFSFDGEGNHERIQRNAGNLITSITDARGFTTRYTYDARGNLLSIFDAGLLGGQSLNSPIDLGPLQTSRSLQAHVGSLDAADFYRLELEAASRLRIVLDDLFEEVAVSIIGDLDGDFEVDANEVLETASSSGSEPLSMIEDLGPGVWYLRVEADTFPGGQNTSYSLELEAVPLPVTTPADPANTLEGALDLGLLESEQAWRDSVDSRDSVDLYRFQLDQTRQVHLVLKDLRESARLSLVADLNGNGAIDAADVMETVDSGGTKPAVITETLGPGTYFVRVSLVGFPTGENSGYTLLASSRSVAVTTPSDPAGNTLSQALAIGSLSSEQRFEDWVGGNDDRDYYRFQIAQNGSPVLIRLSQLVENADLQLIRDANGNGNVDFGDVLASGTLSETNSEQVFATLDAGTYYVGVLPATFPVGENTSYTLDLSVLQAPATTPHVDNGNSLGTAMDVGPLTGNAAFSGSIGGSDTNDFIRFSVTEPVRLRAQLTGLTADARLGLVADIDGNLTVAPRELIAASQRSNAAVPEWFDEEIGPGTYYLRVYQESFDARANTNYVVELLPVAEPGLTPEPGGNFATALPLDPFNGPRTFRDNVGSFDRFDFYAFTLTESATVRARLSELEEDIELGLAADINGNGLLDSNEMVERRSMFGKADEFLEEQLTPGTWYFVVFQNSFQEDRNSHYRLDVDLASAVTTPAVDPGESYATALVIDPFTGPQAFRESVGSLDRHDFYRFTLDEPVTVTARLSELNEDLQLALAADINGDGMFVAAERIELSTQVDKTDEWLREELPPGEYYFVVYQGDFQTDQNSHYLLEIDTRTADTTPASDPGGTVETALTLDLDSGPISLRETVGSLDLQDLYRFTLTEASRVAARLSDLREDLQLGLLADINGNGSLESTERIDLSTQVEKDPDWLEEELAPGTYFLQVFQGQFQTNQNSHYLLEIERVRSDISTPADPGGTLAEALPITVSSRSRTFHENVGSLDRRDFYAFTLAEPGTIQAELRGLSEDLQLALATDINGDGIHEVIEQSTNGGVERDWIDEQLPPGVYYLLVFQGDFQTDQNSDYELEVRFDAVPASTPVDPGEDYAQALSIDPFSGPRTFRQTVGSLDRRDLYTFTLTAPARVTAELDGLDEDLQLGLATDLTGNGYDDADLIETSVGAERNREWLSQELPAGTYAFVVYQGAFQQGENSHYRLNVDLAPIADVRGSEPGNRPGDAADLGTLTADVTTHDIAGSLDRDDYYRFTLSSPQTVELLLRDLDESLDLGLVVDGNGNGNLDFNEQVSTSASGGRSLEWIQADLAAGTYYARVYRGDFATGDNSHYELQVRFPVAASANPSDPGATLSGALSLGTLGGTLARQDFVGTADPHDYYRIVLDDSRQLRVTLSGLTADADIRLIADRDADLVVDSGEVIEQVDSSGSSPALLFEDLVPGTYYIHVFQPTFPSNQNTNYTLEISSTPLAVDPPTDPGGTLAGALDLGLLTGEQAVNEVIGSLDTLDFYRLELDRDSQVKLRLEGLMETAELAIVADENGDLVVQSAEVLETVQSADTAWLTEFLPRGVYYVRVGQVSFPAGENTRYRLVAEANGLPATTLREPGQLLPDALSIGTLLPGTLTGQQVFRQTVGALDRVDLYRFQLEEDLELRVQLRDLQEETVVSLIADLDGDLAIDGGETIETVTGTSGGTALLTEVLPAGTYYLSVAPDTFPAGENSSYTLEINVQALARIPALDPGNTPAEAFDIGPLGDRLRLSQTVGSLDSDDYYRFDLAGVRQVSLRLEGLREELVVSLVADVNNNGSVDAGETIETVTTAGFEALLSEVLGPGSYYLRVQPDTFPAGQNSSYDLQLTSRSLGDSFGPRTFTYDPQFSQLTSEKDELGRLTLYDVDPLNGDILQETRIVGRLDTISGESDDVITRFTYTPAGRIDTVTDPLGRVTDHDHDLLGRLTRITYAQGTADQADSQYEYDAAGNVAAVIDENLNRTEYLYDSLNRLMRWTGADPDGGGVQVSPVTEFDYDAAGNLVSTQDPLNQVTTYEYDLKNRPDSRRDAALQDTVFEHDRAGNLARAVDESGAATENRYDERNRLIATLDPNQGLTRYRYDANDNLIRVTDPLGNVTRYEYDGQNRLERIVDPLSEETRFLYDAVGNRLAKLDRNGRRTEFAYDDLDRLVRETWRAADGTIENVMEYTYDDAGNLRAAVDNASSLQFTYDSRNRLATASNAGTAGAPEVVLTYGYDPAGNILSLADQISAAPAGTTGFQVDNLHRTTRVTQSGVGVAEKRVDLAYDALGLPATLSRYADLAGTMSVVTTTYTHDSLQRVDTITHNNGLSDVAVYDYDYDAAGRVSRLIDTLGSTTYDYDDAGQLVGADHTSREDENYAYDAGGNRVQSSLHGGDYVVDPGNRLRSDGVYSYAYDQEGNLIRRTEIASGRLDDLAYDHRNRLVAVVRRDDGGIEQGRVEYRYDVLDRRIARHVSDGGGELAEYFVHDRDALHLAFLDGDGGGPQLPALASRYLNGPAVDQVLAEERGGEVSWLLADAHGSIRDIVDRDGDLVNSIVYGAFGQVISESDPGVDTRHRFAGRELDRETGLYYFRARYYNPTLGRFLSEDPLGQAAGDTHLTSYAFNDPVNLRDPSGRIVAGLSISSETLRSLAFSRYVVGARLDVQVEQFTRDPWGRVDPLAVFQRAALAASGTAAIRHPLSPEHQRTVDLTAFTLARQSVAGLAPQAQRPLGSAARLLRLEATRLVADGGSRALAERTIGAAGERRWNLAGGPEMPLGFVFDLGWWMRPFGAWSRDVPEQFG